MKPETKKMLARIAAENRLESSKRRKQQDDIAAKLSVEELALIGDAKSNPLNSAGKRSRDKAIYTIFSN